MSFREDTWNYALPLSVYFAICLSAGQAGPGHEHRSSFTWQDAGSTQDKAVNVKLLYLSATIYAWVLFHVRLLTSFGCCRTGLSKHVRLDLVVDNSYSSQGICLNILAKNPAISVRSTVVEDLIIDCWRQAWVSFLSILLSQYSRSGAEPEVPICQLRSTTRLRQYPCPIVTGKLMFF